MLDSLSTCTAVCICACVHHRLGSISEGKHDCVLFHFWVCVVQKKVNIVEKEGRDFVGWQTEWVLCMWPLENPNPKICKDPSAKHWGNSDLKAGLRNYFGFGPRFTCLEDWRKQGFGLTDSQGCPVLWEATAVLYFIFQSFFSCRIMSSLRKTFT